MGEHVVLLVGAVTVLVIFAGVLGVLLWSLHRLPFFHHPPEPPASEQCDDPAPPSGPDEPTTRS